VAATALFDALFLPFSRFHLETLGICLSRNGESLIVIQMATIQVFS
jgi:hypothetical protein